MPHTLPSLPYAYDALEPYIDARTMEIHHTKHHQAYIDKVNIALEGTEWAEKPIEEVVANISQIPEDKRDRNTILERIRVKIDSSLEYEDIDKGVLDITPTSGSHRRIEARKEVIQVVQSEFLRRMK